MLNACVLIGRLARDPELKYTQAGHAVCTFTLAVDRPFKNDGGEKEADFIPCVAWRKTAEVAAQHLSKGRQVAVEGRIQVRTYDDKDGIRKWITEVICDRVEFLGSKKDRADVSDKKQNTGADQGGVTMLGEEVTFDASFADDTFQSPYGQDNLPF